MSDSGGPKSFGQVSRFMTTGGQSPLFPLVGIVGPLNDDVPFDTHKLNIINTAFGADPEFVYGFATHSLMFGSPATGVGGTAALAVGGFADLPTVTQGLLLVAAVQGINHGGTIIEARGGGNDQSAVPANNDGVALVAGFNYIWNGATWDQSLSAPSDSDAIAALAAGYQGVVAFNALYNGTNWQRARNGSNEALFSNQTNSGMVTVSMVEVQYFDAPAAGVQAVATVSDTDSAGRVPIVKSLVASLTIPPAANQPRVRLQLITDIAGTPTTIWERNFGIGAALANGGHQEIALTGLNISGQADQTLTLQFSAAGVAGVIESVAMGVVWSSGT